MDIASFRFPSGTLPRLKIVAGIETLRSGRPVTVSELVRQAIDEAVLKRYEDAISTVSGEEHK